MNKNNYNLLNKYLIAGHSIINVNNYRETRLPPNVWLVMHSACGRSFHINQNFHKVLHNKNNLKSYLTQKQTKLYGPGDFIPNQLITMTRLSRDKLLHGLFTLPLPENIVTTKTVHTARKQSLLYRKGVYSFRLSTLLKKPGIYIGMFCRTIPGLSVKTSTYKMYLPETNTPFLSFNKSQLNNYSSHSRTLNVFKKASRLVPTRTAPFIRKVPTVRFLKIKPKVTVRFKLK